MQAIYHMTYFQAVVIGLIQGLTELFPISSLGHTVLIPSWLGGTWATLVRQESSSESPYLAFIVGLHLATAVVLIGYYAKTWGRIIRGFFTSIATRRVESADQKLAWLLVIATIPVGVAGWSWSTRSGSCSPSPWPRRSSSPSTASSWAAPRSCAAARRPRRPRRAPARAGHPARRRHPARPGRGRGAHAAGGNRPVSAVSATSATRCSIRTPRNGWRVSASSPRCGSARRRSWPCWRESAGRGHHGRRPGARAEPRGRAALPFLLSTPVIFAAGVLKLPT